MKIEMIDMHQPLEDLMSDYYAIVDNFDDLEDAELFEAAARLEPLEDYLIHMNVI